MFPRLRALAPSILYSGMVQRVRFRRAPVLGMILHHHLEHGRNDFVFKLRELRGECRHHTLSPESDEVVRWLRSQRFRVDDPIPAEFTTVVGHSDRTTGASIVTSFDLPGEDEDVGPYIRSRGIDLNSPEDRTRFLRRDTDGGVYRYHLRFPGAVVGVHLSGETVVDVDYLETLRAENIGSETTVHNFWTREFFPWTTRRMTQTPRKIEDPTS